MNRFTLRAIAGVLLLCALLMSPVAQAQLISNGSGGSLVLNGIHVIDTDTGEIDSVPSPGWDGLHFHFVDITVEPIAQVSVIGAAPLTLLASGNVLVNGSMVGRGVDGTAVLAEDVGGAVGGIGGPGGYAGGIGGGNSPFDPGTYFRSPGVLGDGPAGGEGGIAASSDEARLDTGSGGGGGHVEAGATGGSAGNGAGGPGGGEVASGFLGGSGGGGGSQEDDNDDIALHAATDDGGAGGGGGGAAIRVVAAGTLAINGLVDVSGGAGGDSVVSGAGGGGAGGRVELYASTVPSVAGLLMIDGGAGGVGPEMPMRGLGAPNGGGPDGGSGAAGTTRVESYAGAQCSMGGSNLVLVPGSYTIDTDTGELDGAVSAAFDGFAFHFFNIDIADGATLVAKGTAPLVLLAGGDVTVAGIIDAAGQDGDSGGGARDGGARGVAGPGGFPGGRGGGVSPGSGIADGEPGSGPGAGDGGLYPAIAVGGGGGGHSTVGQDSMNTNGVPAAGGAAYAIDLPLVGGSGGGGGTVHNSASTGGGGGGGGGGAVRLIGAGDMTVTGTIDVHGGEGGRGPGRAGGGGGGSAGSIDLQTAGTLSTGAATLNISGGVAGISGTGTAGGGTGADGRLTTAASACVVPQSDLSIAKTADPAIFAPGAQVTYMISVTNEGPLVANQVNVTDLLPAELSAVSWDCFPEPGASCTAQGTGNINDDMVSLPVGVSVLYVVTATTPTPFVGVLNNTATVTPLTVADSDTGNNSATGRTATDQAFADGFETQAP